MSSSSWSWGSAPPIVGLGDLAQDPVELAAGDLRVAVLAVPGLVDVAGGAAVGALLVGDTTGDQGLGPSRSLEGPKLGEGPVRLLASDRKDLLAGLVIDLVVHGAGVDLDRDHVVA